MVLWQLIFWQLSVFGILLSKVRVIPVPYVTSIYKKAEHSEQSDVMIKSHQRANHVVEDTTIAREEAVHWGRGTGILWRGISWMERWDSGGKIELTCNGYVCTNVVYVTFRFEIFMPNIDSLSNVSLFGFLLEKEMKIPVEIMFFNVTCHVATFV